MIYLGTPTDPLVSLPLVALGVELLNMLFHFIGFISLAAFLSKLLFCRGSVCNAARADAVIAGFGWIFWTASCAETALAVFRGHRAVRLDKEAAIAVKETAPIGNSYPAPEKK